MNLLVALGVSALGFFIITGTVFAVAPNNPFNGMAIQFNCHSVSQAELQKLEQTLRDFYQYDAPFPGAYLAWLLHGLTGQWQPDFTDCPFTVPMGATPLYFDAGIAIWAILTLILVVYVFIGRRPQPGGGQPLSAQTEGVAKLATFWHEYTPTDMGNPNRPGRQARAFRTG